MKPILKNIWVLIVILSASISALAYDFEADGIYYNILSLEDMTCEVTYNADKKTSQTLSFYDRRGSSSSGSSLSNSCPSYSGNLEIPSTVNYKGRTLSVVGIGEYAFLNCRDLTSLSLPSSITNIAEVLVYDSWACYAGAFDYCNIETLTAGNSYILEMFDQSYAKSVGYQTKDNLKNLILADDFVGTINVNFSNYKKLTSIRSNVKTPPAFSEGEHFSNEQFLNTEVLVREDAFAKFQSADVWKDFWELKPMKSVKSILLNETSLNLEPQQSIRLTANVLPEDAFDASLTWTSSNPDVVSVESDGLVTAHTKGDAVVMVSANDGSNITAQCSVHVDLLVKEIELSEIEIGLEPGDSKKLAVVIKPDNAFIKDVVWSSDNEEIATVDHDGNVIAKNVGTAIITVQTTDGSDLSANCTVKVVEFVKFITILPSEAAIKAGETLQLSCAVEPKTATYKDVIWTSDDNDIVTVDSQGLVTAVSSGTTQIKANSSDGSNVCGECTVTVTSETIVVDGIYYQCISPSTLKIVANKDYLYSGDFFVAENIEVKGVVMSITEIGADAFADCKDLTRIIIPNSIEKIREGAFKGCSNLVYVKLCDGSPVVANFDVLFPDSPISEVYIGSDGISYNSESRTLRSLKGMTLGNSVTTFPPKEVFSSLEYFIVEDGDMPIAEPEDYCSSSMSLVNQQTIKDPYTLIMYRTYYLVTYLHLSPIYNAIEQSMLNYLHIGRDVNQIEVDKSKTQELIPTTAGSRYQEYGYEDEIHYQYNEGIVKSDYNRYPIESIHFSEPVIEMNIGETIKLSVEYIPTNASFKTVTWSSSNEDVAIVDIFGNVTKVADGTAEITVTTTDGSNFSATCQIVNPGDIIEDDIETIPSKNGIYSIYTLLGIKVLETNDVERVKQLPKGIYLVNGNKVVID